MLKISSTAGKVLVGVIVGVTAVGGFATAAGTFSGSTSVICADNRTNALYAAPSNGVCASNRSAISLSQSSASTLPTTSIKSVVQKVSPSVVTVNVTVSGGGDTGSGSIIQSDASTSYVLTNNHVIEAAATSGTIKIEMDNSAFEQYPGQELGLILKDLSDTVFGLDYTLQHENFNENIYDTNGNKVGEIVIEL